MWGRSFYDPILSKKIIDWLSHWVMYKRVFDIVAYFAIAITSFGQTSTPDTSVTNFPTNILVERGAWCWFADPRAIHYSNGNGTINSTYIGYIDALGSIKATQINHLTNTTNEVLIRSYFQPDDHNNPTFLVLPDERVMIFYSRHTDESCFYYRVSAKPGDITTLGKEFRLETKHNTTYPSPFILSDDPDHIYLCWRGINWHPTIARLTLPGTNDNVKFDWGPYQIVRSMKGRAGVRPYAKYLSNGKNKIYMTYTTTHPENEPVNYVYFNYIDINTKELIDVKGKKLSTLGEAALHDIDATQAYKEQYPDAVVDDSNFRNWLWELSKDKLGNPVIAMVRISTDKKSHDYYYVRWTGVRWQKTYLTNAGGHFHQTPDIENCYSGGMAIDKTDPHVIYGSVPVEGKYGRVYELKKFTIAPDGRLASVEQLTFNSPKNNVRPFAIMNHNSEVSLTWMYGDYYDWIVSVSRPKGFATGIRTNMAISPGSIDLKKGFLREASAGRVSSKDRSKIRVAKSKTFTLALMLSLDSSSYYGDIIKFAGLTYSLPQSERPKPFLKSESKTYTSTNVLGSSAIWQTKRKGTDGQWYMPTKLKTFQLVITYENGLLRTYIDGLIDQSVEVAGLQLQDVVVGGFDGVLENIKIFNRALSQGEVKAL